MVRQSEPAPTSWVASLIADEHSHVAASFVSAALRGDVDPAVVTTPDFTSGSSYDGGDRRPDTTRGVDGLGGGLPLFWADIYGWTFAWANKQLHVRGLRYPSRQPSSLAQRQHLLPDRLQCLRQRFPSSLRPSSARWETC